MTDRAAAEKNRYKVLPGNVGADVATPLKDGKPVMENLSRREPPSPPSSLPSVVGEQEEDKAVILRPSDEIGNFRFALVDAFSKMAAKKNKSKAEIVRNFLELYNQGVMLPGIYKKLGPISRSTLYVWLKAFNEGGIENLAPENGRKGDSKVTGHEKNIVLTLLLHQNRLKIAYGIALAKDYLAEKQIPSPSSPRTLRRFVDRFREEHYDLWVRKREGDKALNDKVSPYAERDPNLLEVGEGIVADGHRLNFQIIHPVTGKPCRAAIVLFWDWRSSYPLGWEIMTEENIQCVASALRNAILTLGKTPKWVLLDNGKAFKAKIFTEDISFEETELPGMFARLDIRCHFAQVYNAQAKPIERIFGILNEQLERTIPSYTGASIEDKPAWTKRNEKYARSLHDPYVPTVEETNDLIRAWRDRYAGRPSRGRNGLRPIDIFKQGKGPGVDPKELIFLMMDRQIKDIHRNGITWLGWHWCDEALYGLKTKVVMRYSLSDLSQVYIFYKNEFLCAASPIKRVHPMASETESPKDMEAVNNVLRLKQRVKNTTRKLCDLLDTKAAGEIDWSRSRTPEISEVIQKIEKRKEPKTIDISPFVDDPEPPVIKAEGEVLIEQDEEPKGDRPWFDGEYEKYGWLMKQDCFDPEDRNFIARFRRESSLYRAKVFGDEEELDRKVRLWEERHGTPVPGGET